MNAKILELINRRERQLLVHSYLYYQANDNIISDSTFDLWSKELADLMVKYPEEFKASAYWGGFLVFDGSSGFDLPYRSPDVVSRAKHLLHYHREVKGMR